MTVHTIAAAILAGGRARRFGGRDKSRLIVEGRPIIIRQVEVLQRVASRVFVVGLDPDRFADLPLAVHADVVPNAGAIGGVYTALDVADEEAVITVACDLPFLDVGLLARLVELTEDHDGAWVHTPRGVEPLIACYRSAARPTIRRQIDAGRLKVADLASVLRIAEMEIEEVARFGRPERLLANVNTPEDYAGIVQYGAS